MWGGAMRDEFVHQVKRYLNREITLDDLEDWAALHFVTLTSLGEADPVARLWATLQASVYELDAEHVDETWCRAALSDALEALQPAAWSSRPRAWQSMGPVAAVTLKAPSRFGASPPLYIRPTPHTRPDTLAPRS